MPIIINNTPLSRIFANNKPVRKVVVANGDGTGQQVVFNTLLFTVVVTITGSGGDVTVTNTMTVFNNSPYAETFCFCVGRLGWKSEHASELDIKQDYLLDSELPSTPTIDELREAGVLSEFTIQGNSNRQFSLSFSTEWQEADIRLLRKNNNGDYKLIFYNGSLADKYERYLITFRPRWGSNTTKTYSIDEANV